MKILHFGSFLKLSFLSITLLWFSASPPAHAQLADGFNPDPNDTVEGMIFTPEGDMIIGGHFFKIYGESRWRMAKLSLQGALDPFFKPAIGQYMVGSIALQTDGKMLIEGLFDILNGQPCTNFARLNPDGTRDPTFQPPTTAQSLGYLALQADGKILVSGFCSNWLNTSGHFIARLHPDGSPDETFRPVQFSGGYYPSVSSLAFQTDGKMVVGGYFTNLWGQPSSCLARLNADGTLDQNFHAQANNSVYSVVVQADGRILVGGYFTKLNGQPRNGLARLNTDGSVDPDLVVTNIIGRRSIALQADGRILIACQNSFDKYRIVRLEPSGAVDPAFNAEVSWFVDALALQPDGKVLAGGPFWSLGGQPRNHFGRLNNTEPATQNLTYSGSTITWLRGGTSPEVWQTRFDASINGIDWIPLGPGQRVAGGWECTNISLPANCSIRARGWVSCGEYNRSTWFIETSIGAVSINRPPADRTNNAGTTALFTVNAGGTPPISYQWLKNGIPLEENANMAGVQSPALTLSNLLRADAAGYSVVVSNSLGSVTSLVAVLRVLDPAINLQPTNQLVNAGQTATLAVAAGATLPASFQWFKDGLALEGQNATSLNLTNIQWSDRGHYQLVISNEFGMLTSAVAVLTLNMAPPDAFHAVLGAV